MSNYIHAPAALTIGIVVGTLVGAEDNLMAEEKGTILGHVE
jgi:hypothetical protein